MPRPPAAGLNTRFTDEDPQLSQVAAHAPSRQPDRAPQGPRLHHQQDPEALQGASGLRPRAFAAEVLTGRVPSGRPVFVCPEFELPVLQDTALESISDP